MNYNAAMFAGLKLVPSTALTETEKQPRSWKERLFSRPWRPFTKTKYVFVPSRKVYQVGDTIYAHPTVLKQIQEALSKCR